MAALGSQADIALAVGVRPFSAINGHESRNDLLRLWLACADGPALPAAFTGEHQGKTKDGRPDGINVPGVPLAAPLRAEE